MDKNTLQSRLFDSFKLLKEPQDNWTYGEWNEWNDWNNRRKIWVNQMNAVMPIYNYPVKTAYTPDDNNEDEQPGACCGCE